MAESKIEWTDATWNPTTGCTRASAGCDHCYAFTMTKRLAAMGQEKYQGLVGSGHFNGVVKTHEAELTKPLRWRKPRVVFVNSMSDLFHKDVPFAFVDRVFGVMIHADKHTYQILTKRPERMAEYFETRQPARPGIDTVPPQWLEWINWQPDPFTHNIVTRFKKCRREETSFSGSPWPQPNIWLGTSVENQATADERIPHLVRCPAAVRFLSCEPLLGPVNLTSYLGATDAIEKQRGSRLPSDRDGRIGNRRSGANMEGSSAQVGSVDAINSNNPMPASTSRKEVGALSPGSCDDRREASACLGSPPGVSALSRANSPDSDSEPQRRRHNEQSPGEPGTGHTRGANSPPDQSDRSRSSPELGAISWCIVGGESGHHARPCQLESVREIVQQCKAAGVPIFVKQLGARLHHFQNRIQLRDKKGGDWSEWPSDLRVREFPNVAAAIK